MNFYRLPGIRKIHIVRCNHLSAGAMLQSMGGLTVSITAPVEEIDFVGVAELKWESSRVKGRNEEKSTLQFTTLQRLPEGERLAFVVETPGGEQYLIGTKEGRYPIIEWSETTGEAGKSSAARAYKITHVGQKSVLRCVL